MQIWPQVPWEILLYRYSNVITLFCIIESVIESTLLVEVKIRYESLILKGKLIHSETLESSHNHGFDLNDIRRILHVIELSHYAVGMIQVNAGRVAEVTLRELEVTFGVEYHI